MSLYRDFKEWRNSRTKKGKIPDYLWDKVLKLLDYCPTSKVIEALQLSGAQVSRRRKQAQTKTNSKTLPVTQPVNFVELNVPSVIPCHSAITTVGNKLEIKRPNGAILTLERLSEQMIFQLLNQFARTF